MSTAPVWTSAVPAMKPEPAGANRLTTHSGRVAATTGKGGPNVSVLSDPKPVGPHAVQSELLLESHWDRQSLNRHPPGMRTLWNVPDQPLSRSVSLSPTVMSSSFGPPAGLSGQAFVGIPWQTVETKGASFRHEGGGGDFSQCNMSTSTSFSRASDIATTRILRDRGLSLCRPLSLISNVR